MEGREALCLPGVASSPQPQLSPQPVCSPGISSLCNAATSPLPSFPLPCSSEGMLNLIVCPNESCVRLIYWYFRREVFLKSLGCSLPFHAHTWDQGMAWVVVGLWK